MIDGRKVGIARIPPTLYYECIGILDNSLGDAYVFWTALIVANILMYAATIAVGMLWSRLFALETLRITRQDAATSVTVLLVNIIVAVPGYLLLTRHYIQFDCGGFSALEFAGLVIGFDFAMYSLHYLSHTMQPFRGLHHTHHTHHNFNAISLYVMHPLEACFLGMLMTVCALVFTLNLYSFLLFILFNWMFGVIAHLNSASSRQPLLLGDYVFHKEHHQRQMCNFGFYTVIWDKLFGTYGDRCSEKTASGQV